MSTTVQLSSGGSSTEEQPKSEPGQGICYLSATTGDEELRRFWEVEDYNLDRAVMSLQEKAVVERFC